MTKLSDTRAVEALLEQFGGFFDAVLVEVSLKLPRASRHRHGEVRLLAKETSANEGGHWRLVTVRIEGLTEFRLTEGNGSNLVLSDGLAIHNLNGNWFLDLSPFTDNPLSEADLRRSSQYLVGASCSCEISEPSGDY